MFDPTKVKTLGPALLILIIGCSWPEEPTPETTPEPGVFAYSWETRLSGPEGWNSGQWDWTWTSADSSAGKARLGFLPLPPPSVGWQIKWEFSGLKSGILPLGTMDLQPLDEEIWHPFFWEHSGVDSVITFPFPLPIQEVESNLYSGVLELLKTLITPYFHQVIVHWRQATVPVRLVPAQNGSLDLAACLTEAVGIWNEGEDQPWFEINPDAAWGLRLVHFPGRHLHPPLFSQITRLESPGHPARIHIVTGDNYDDPWDRVYAVRGFVHELAHALFLWGHSLDNQHSLWGRGPPLVSAPSLDERKAARWMRGLPEGLDLSQYEVSPSGD